MVIFESIESKVFTGTNEPFERSRKAAEPSSVETDPDSSSSRVESTASGKTESSSLPARMTNAKDGSVFLLVPAGEFEMGDGKNTDWMGDGRNTDCPKHRVWLDAYYIGETCVTNAQYAKFVREGGVEPDNFLWNDPKFTEHPVTDISWNDASAYAAWAGCELPTEAQWEKAARGPEGYLYPWGNEWDPLKCRHRENLGGEETAPVKAYPEGRSGYGTYQQSGNVDEWCLDRYGANYYDTDAARRNPEGPSGRSDRVFRGGSWRYDNPSYFRTACRRMGFPGFRFDNLGFRLASKA